jgi:hypothetical protein
MHHKDIESARLNCRGDVSIRWICKVEPQKQCLPTGQTAKTSNLQVEKKKKNSILRLPTKEWYDKSGHSQRPPFRPPKRRGSVHRAKAGCTMWLPMSGQNPVGNKGPDICVGKRGVTEVSEPPGIDWHFLTSSSFGSLLIISTQPNSKTLFPRSLSICQDSLFANTLVLQYFGHCLSSALEP